MTILNISIALAISYALYCLFSKYAQNMVRVNETKITSWRTELDSLRHSYGSGTIGEVEYNNEVQKFKAYIDCVTSTNNFLRKLWYIKPSK